jgi:hypothetical protein
MNEKIIVTNLSALKAKYGATGLKKINAVIEALIAADKARGLRTRLIALDSARAMKSVKGKKVSNVASPRQNKAAIDAVYASLVPDYLLLLGAIDVIPHQDLRNLVFDGDNDPDEFSDGDLPYACDAPYSQETKDFIGPTRVVGRLPDLVGASNPGYLLGVLGTAATWEARKAADYTRPFAISAAVWKKSTSLSLQKLFGSSTDLNLSPPDGPLWSKPLLARRAHFINCHGGKGDPTFLGQKGQHYPEAHRASHVAGKISEGTVAAIECCYGAELYDPALAAGQAGICSTYLADKAYGYFGSSTIAYGPARGNGSADLICQYFLRRVKAGASLGRAALEARLEFAGGTPELDPVDLKTLAQFNLLGDPSITPVATTAPPAAAARKSFAGGVSPAIARADRRRQLFARGRRIVATQSVAARVAEPKLARPLLGNLRNLASEMGLSAPNVLSFRIEEPVAPRGAKALGLRGGPLAKITAPSRFHLVIGRQDAADNTPAPPVAARMAKRAAREIPPYRPDAPIVVLIAKEVAGKIVSYREMHSR